MGKKLKWFAPDGFDPSTFGLWAQHASSAPRSRCCPTYTIIHYYTRYNNKLTYLHIPHTPHTVSFLTWCVYAFLARIPTASSIVRYYTINYYWCHTIYNRYSFYYGMQHTAPIMKYLQICWPFKYICPYILFRIFRIGTAF